MKGLFEELNEAEERVQAIIDRNWVRIIESGNENTRKELSTDGRGNVFRMAFGLGFVACMRELEKEFKKKDERRR